MTGVFSKLSLFYSQYNCILKAYSNSTIKASLLKLEYSSISHLVYCLSEKAAEPGPFQHSCCGYKPRHAAAPSESLYLSLLIKAT